MHNPSHKGVPLLYRLERILKLDVVYLARGGGWMTLSFVVSTLASLVTMVAFGNLLPRETYGTYNYLLSLAASLSFLTLSGIGIAVIRAVARGHENVVPIAVRLQLKYNLVAVATVLVAAFYYGYKGNAVFAFSLAILAFAYPLAEAFHIYVQVLTGRKRFDLLTKITSVITLFATLATVITLLLTDNILVLIAVYGSMALIPKIIAYIITARNIKEIEPDAGQLAEMRRTAFHVTGAGLIGTAAAYVDKILLFQVAGPAALAVYGFAIAGPERLRSLVKNWTVIAAPRLAQTTLGEIRHSLYRRICFSLLVGLALFLVYLFLAPILFQLFLPLYLDAVPYSQVQALGLIVAPVIIYIGAVFASQNMLRATYVLSVGTQIVRIILFVVLGLLWQIWGLVIASILSSLLNAIYGIIIWELETRRIMKKNEQP